jgi:1,4-alpha-glucan branching enzyme
VISFQRRGKKEEDTLVFISNFTPVVRHQYRVGVPFAGVYSEVLNSDASHYGGSGVVNTEPMRSEPLYWQSCPHSIVLTLPPLATIILKGQPQSVETAQPRVEIEEEQPTEAAQPPVEIEQEEQK